ncbi:hypothetical protein [Paracoccus rhizosphaerae]|uniref:Uncharacterized protein n=1 Tax=Paracoccus rhizosphaerae TaxID=1133347 RepID=A0ABV6CLW6_9RHOB|nr:hypothetical protein [Paracoccus rhizosphaerae]
MRSCADGVSVPFVSGTLARDRFDPVQHAQVRERRRVAGDGQRQRPCLRTRAQVRRQKARSQITFIKMFDDRQ